ncbi:glycosyltransferase family 4 protein [Candidatus Marsarchaeota archaeon]|jgi:glycosyltransferase involved in cell wall biosynthesis|nr:glycosyltransferase family 4 protein [Candidatus Marsarchaeota archaeon]
MDICVLNPYFYPYFGGTEKVLLEIYKRLSKSNNITVITSSVGSEPGEETIEGIRVLRLKTSQRTLPHLPLPLASMEGLNAAIEKTGAEIYHINNRYQYFSSTIRAIKERSSGRIALTIHNSLPKNIDPITDFGGLAYDMFWGRRIMRSADIITAVSKSAMETTVPIAFRKKSKVIFNGIDYRLFMPSTEKSKVEKTRSLMGFDDGILLISNGRLTTQKGHAYLMRAVAELNRIGKPTNLFLIGRGPMEKKLNMLAKKLGIENRVKISHGISEQDLPYYYNAADIFVFPSLYEPAGMAMLEALSCGTPTIATGIGGIPEALKNYGEYIKIKDVKSITDATIKVFSDMQRYKKLALECRENVIKKEHDWDTIARKYEESFEQTLRA